MHQRKLLIVEDETIIALDIKARLQNFGCEVVGIASSYNEAVELSVKHLPDLILMDIAINGDKNGIDAAIEIKKRLSIPSIFLTANWDEATLEKASQVDPAGYLLKPFKDEELFTTVYLALSKNRTLKRAVKQERLFETILYNMENAVIATDRNNRVHYMNSVAENMTGWEMESALNEKIEDVLILKYNNSKRKFNLLDLIERNGEKIPCIIDNSILENRNSKITPVEGTITNIMDDNGQVEGQVFMLRDITCIKRMNDTISYQASHDLLTGLVNREGFSIHLKNLIDNAKKVKSLQHALLYLDIDQFKVINDTAGHAAGDELLLKITKIILSVVRNSDTCARLGGDQFGILLDNSSPEQAKVIAKRLHLQLHNFQLTWGGKIFKINSSIGLVIIDSNSKDSQSVLANADDACYLAKEEGGDRIRIYETTNYNLKKRRGDMQWVSRIIRALEEDRFQLYYQPIVPLFNPEKFRSKYEILLRKIDQNGNVILPGDFMPAAERYNLMPAIDRCVIKNAMMHFKRIKQKTKIKKLFSINLSAASLADETFLDFVYEQFEEININPEGICFEITESIAVSNISGARKFMNSLKKIGCTFALDDFGSGFSSFSYLKDLPADYLKIDGSYVKDIDEDPVNYAMVEAINSMSHVIGMKTIAEYVQDTAVRQKVKEIGVDFIQGYHVAHPQPISNMIVH